MTDRAGDDKAHVRHALDLSSARWQAAGDEGELAFVPHIDGATYVALRRADAPGGPVLVFTESEWDAFLAGGRDGEFDRPWLAELPPDAR